MHILCHSHGTSHASNTCVAMNARLLSNRSGHGAMENRHVGVVQLQFAIAIAIDPFRHHQNATGKLLRVAVTQIICSLPRAIPHLYNITV